MTTDPTSSSAASPLAVGGASRLLLLVIAYLGFISLGLPDPVAGVAWPSMREQFGLEQSSFGLVFIGLGCGYCASGFFGGKLTYRLGLGNLLWSSSALVAAAMFLSGAAPAWIVVVCAAVVWGLGSGGIDAGLNAYASKHFSARHMNWLHACYSLGATLGPLVMTATLLRLGSWRWGYGLVGGALAAMAALFLATRSSWNERTSASDEPAASPIGVRAALRSRLVRWQIVLFFLYVGLEFTVGQWCFTLLTEARDVRAELAGTLAGAYYLSIGVGRVIAGAIAPRVGLDRLLRAAMLLALSGAVLYAWASPVELSFAGLILIGFGLAPVFPCLMTRTPQRLGAETATHAVGFQVSAGMIGAALVPALTGLLIERLGLQFAAVFAVVLAALLCTVHEFVLRRSAFSAELHRKSSRG